MDPQLTAYITSQLKKGLTKTEIVQALADKGWPTEVILEGFQALGEKPLTDKQILGSTELLNRAYAILKINLRSLLFLSFAPMAITIVMIVLCVLMFAIGTAVPMVYKYIGITIATIFVVATQLWTHVALYEVIIHSQKKLGWRDAMRKTTHKVAGFWWIAFLSGFLIFGGLILFIVPGILFTIWFEFCLMIYMTDGEKGMRAILKSREYVRGNVGAIMTRVGFLVLLFAAVSFFSSILGAIFNNEYIKDIISFTANIIMSPFGLSYSYVLFENIKAIKGPVHVKEHSGIVYIIIAFVGVIASIALFGLSLYTLFSNASSTAFHP